MAGHGGAWRGMAGQRADTDNGERNCTLLAVHVSCFERVIVALTVQHLFVTKRDEWTESSRIENVQSEDERGERGVRGADSSSGRLERTHQSIRAWGWPLHKCRGELFLNELLCLEHSERNEQNDSLGVWTGRSTERKQGGVGEEMYLCETQHI
ncbi:hypothetical protein RR46_00958 [Papilio xuthus]|uniref:Uncharacterized protein n=1 Tax=Papilio xuthus TaxID=66420 RepID=A0A0N0PA29_PAPXU|nr:hypothetical protein RR46_00958 [Papilio xuthus]